VNLARFSVRNPVTANLLMWGIVIGGAVAGFNLRKELFPTVDPELITVSVAFPGATPEEVERLVARRIERAVEGVTDVDEITSVVFEGLVQTNVKLVERADRAKALNDVRSAIDNIRADLPDAAEEPDVKELRPILPVISLAVFGNVAEDRLRDAAIRVRDDLQEATGTSEVQISGLRAREIWVEIRPEKLEEHGLTFEEVGRVLAGSNLDLPAGQLKSGAGNIRVRTLGERNSASGISSYLIKSLPDGRTVQLADIATVRETFEDRVENGRFRGKPGVLVTVFKKPEEDAVEIADAVKAFAAGNPAPFGDAIELEPTRDLSRFIEQRLDLMVRNARIGLTLVILVLTIFLEVRVALWVAVGLAVSFLGTFLAMSLIGATINLISLFGLIVVLGLLVDDAIVIGENVYTKKRMGMPPDEAAIVGTTEVAAPVVATIATSMIAFAPLAFITGRVGVFLGVLPVVVVCALGVSLFEAFIVLPCHLSHGVRPSGDGWFSRWSRRIGDLKVSIFEHKLRAGFGVFLEKALRYRYVTLTVGVVSVMVMVALFKGGHIKFEFLGTTDAETAEVSLEMAPGTSEAETLAVLKDVEKLVAAQPEVESIFTVQGATYRDGRRREAADPATVGQLTVEMKSAEWRVEQGLRRTDDVVNALRLKTLEIPGVRKLSFNARAGGPGGADIEIRTRGSDIAKVTAATEYVRELVGSYEGVTEVFDDVVEGKLELRYRLRDEARSLGLTTRDLAMQVRHALFGFEVQDLQEEEEEITVRVLLPESARTRIEDLGRLRIATPGGGRVPLDEIAALDTGRGYSTLTRADGQRAFTVTASLDARRANAQEITADLETKLAGLGDRFRGVTYDFEGEKAETRKSLAGLQRGFMVAILGIYCIVAILFRSYTQPLLVMVAIPVGFVGVVFGHLIMGYSITVLSLIGSVALAGIVVNDSLILVDLINRKRNEDNELDTFTAVLEGSKARLRAILLTSVTTIAGLGPLMLETSFQAQFLIPMAISICFGLAFATGLILVIIPSLYLVFNDVRRFLRWSWSGVYVKVPEA
jgi:multidrug efflux pump subunit AcrB